MSGRWCLLRVKNTASFSPLAGEDRLSAAPGVAASWIDHQARGFVRRVLSPMLRGRLEMVAPDGTVDTFGGLHPGPEARMVVRDHRFYRRCARTGDIGFGEAYQAGEWETDDLCAVIEWFCANTDSAPTMAGSKNQPLRLQLFSLANRVRHWMHRNTISGSKHNIHAHYDLGNRFYELWLDPTMTYSAALFEAPDQQLEAAQVAKYDRLCRQLRLKPGHEVLEIGSGWGGFTSHAVRKYGCRVTTVTISTEQHRFAQERFQREGIAHRAEVLLMDYRKLLELGRRFDRIASIEMLEAVGDSFLETYFDVVQRLLWPGGLFAAQFITCADSKYDELRRSVDWIQKHVFPGSLLLSLNRVNEAIARTGRLQMHDLKDFGPDYARTLRIWRERFNARLDEVTKLGFDTHFIRTWNYYLAYCEAAFAQRNISVVQGLWTVPNNPTL
jgi:cyclopropane-fatty-acyl-phospholipid synthase